MRKVNSKATLQPNNSGNGSSIGMSPSTIKQHSMIKLYKVQTGSSNQQTKVNVNIQPSTLIAKTIQARRNQNNNITNQPVIQNRTNHNITMMIGQDQNNNSVQTVKPSTIFSPGDTIQRKNLDITTGTAQQKTSNNQIQQHQWDKQSPLSRQKLFTNPEYNSVGPKTNELYNNMRKQLEKQRSLQSLFNTTQKIANQSTLRHQNSTTQLNPQQPKTSRNIVQQSNTLESQRSIIRRGSKYQGNVISNGFIGAYHTTHNSIINNSQNLLNCSQRSGTSNNNNNPNQQQMFMFKNNLSNMTRNKSAFLNFNSTQPVPSSQVNKTQIELRNDDKNSVKVEKKKIQLHNQSPSVSSDEEKKSNKDASKIKNFNTSNEKTVVKIEVKRPLPNLGSHQKKRSQLPHGSFIETKMKNCLHSRNADTSAHAYQTYQGNLNQKAILQKNQSQPNLYHQKNINLTQRTTFVKTSFLRHDDSRSVTPMNAASSKSPNGHSTRDDKLSTKSKTKPIQGLKGDMKSLNLSPIVPQNLGKNKNQFQREPSHSDYQKSNIATAQKRLEMRKGSVNSTNNNQKPFSSLKKDKSAIELNKQQTSLRDEPTTEKKTIKKDIIASNAKKYQKPGYSSQETERGPGGTNSYSTTDDINLISNEFHSKYILRFKNDGSQTRKMFLNDKVKQQYQGQFTEGIAVQDDSICIMKQEAPLFDKTQESKIKVNQILSNNNLSQTSNRYNINLNPDQIFLPPTIKETKHVIQQLTHKTPRNLPFLNDDTINYESQQFKKNKFIIPQSDEDQLTQKKTKQYEEHKSDSSFDEDDDMVNEKDFEEFDRVEKSHEQSQNSLKVRVQIIDQDSIFRDVKTQPNNNVNHNALNNYNQAANNLHNCNTTGYDAQGPASRYSNYYQQKDDRNSLVNYDTSLLTHNTGRDNDSSPISEIKDAKQNKQLKTNNGQQQKAKQQNRQGIKGGNDFITLFPDANSFIAGAAPIQDQTIEMINTKTDDGYCDDQIFDQYQDDYHDSNTQYYKNIMIQLQKEEEKEIEHITQQMLISQKYRNIKNDKEKAKYLSGQISQIRNKYKQLLIEKVLAHQ